MPKFYIHETMHCEVTFVREIEAENAEEAGFADAEQGGTYLGAAIGDNLPSVADYKVTEAGPFFLPSGFLAEPSPVADAAPDLLAAAVALLKDWDAPDLNDATPIAERFDALRAAVAKAEGGR